MARDGSGNFSRVEGPYVNGAVADADEMNNEMDDIADALSDSVNTSGTKAMGADWSMGGHKITDVATATNNTDAANKAYVDAKAVSYAQPLDATLTALAALSWSSLTPVVQFTAADTVSLTSAPACTTVTGGTASNGITLSSSALTRNNVAGSLSIIAGTNAGNSIAFQTGGSARFAITDANIQSNMPVVPATNDLAALGSTTLMWSDLFLASGGVINANNGNATITHVTGGFEVGGTFRGRVPASTETTGTLTSVSANKTIQATGNITLDGNVFAAGDFVFIYAGASARTLTQGATGTPTQRLHGSATTGNLTLAARGTACVFFISATEWVVSGDVT